MAPQTSNALTASNAASKRKSIEPNQVIILIHFSNFINFYFMQTNYQDVTGGKAKCNGYRVFDRY